MKTNVDLIEIAETLHAMELDAQKIMKNPTKTKPVKLVLNTTKTGLIKGEETIEKKA